MTDVQQKLKLFEGATGSGEGTGKTLEVGKEEKGDERKQSFEMPLKKVVQSSVQQFEEQFERNNGSNQNAIVKEVTTGMIADAMVRVALRRLLKTQQQFKESLERLIIQVGEINEAAGKLTEKLAEQIAILADSFRVKLIHYGHELYKAILGFRDRTLVAARAASEAASKAFQAASAAGAVAGEAIYDKLKAGKDLAVQGLQYASAQAVVLTTIAGLFVAEIIGQIHSVVNEILEALTNIGKAAYAKMVQFYDTAMEFVKQMQDDLDAYLEKARAERAERRVIMIRRVQAMKKDLYLTLLKELEDNTDESSNCS